MFRRIEPGPRLAYYGKAPDVEHWASVWERTIGPAVYADAALGWLGPFEGAFTRHLPRDGRVIEAGCGLGQYVLALLARGYEVEGVEWAGATVQAVKRLHPDLPVRQGDVTRLDATDGFYGAYISLGVMEHRREGPEPFLVEAFRVVRDGGVMLVSVPFFNRFRALKAAVGFYRGSVGDREFYQYAYSKETFSDILERHGFRVVERIPYDAAKGLSDEVPGMRRFLAGPFGRRLRGRLMRSDAANRVFGHMMLYVAVKTARAVAA